MNHKGQSLVLFVLIMPFIFLLIVFVLEVGNLLVLENKYENDIKDVITYGLNNMKDDNIQIKLQNLLSKNIDADSNIIIKDNTIEVSVLKKYKILKFNYNIDLTYEGHKEDKIIINRK